MSLNRRQALIGGVGIAAAIGGAGVADHTHRLLAAQVGQQRPAAPLLQIQVQDKHHLQLAGSEVRCNKQSPAKIGKSFPCLLNSIKGRNFSLKTDQVPEFLFKKTKKS